MSNELGVIREKKRFDNSTQTFDLINFVSKLVQTDLCSSMQKNAYVQTNGVKQKDEFVQTGPIDTKDSSAQYDKYLHFRNFGTQTDYNLVAEEPGDRWPNAIGGNDDLPEMDLSVPLAQDLTYDSEDDFFRPKAAFPSASTSKRSEETFQNQLLRPLSKMMNDGYFLNKNLLYAKPEAKAKSGPTRDDVQSKLQNLVTIATSSVNTHRTNPSY